MSGIIEHKVLKTGLHCIIDNKGHVHVFSEEQYIHNTWWNKIKTSFLNKLW